MSEEVLIPKMRRLDKKQKKIKIPLLNLLLIFVCIILLIASTFINIDLKHYILPDGFISNKNFKPEDYIYSFSIVPQIPVVMFVCSFLGKKMSASCIMLYLILELVGFPFFALGGGLSYIKEYSFGYLLAYIPAIIVAGMFLNKKYSILNMLLAAVCGVLIIHSGGIIYMMLVALLKQDGVVFISGWINAQSGLKVVYDLVLSFVAVIIGGYLHSFLKFITD